MCPLQVAGTLWAVHQANKNLANHRGLQGERRKDFLDAHLSFMGRCVDKLQATTNMGGIAEIIRLMLDTPTATDERIHAAQFYSW